MVIFRLLTSEVIVQENSSAFNRKYLIKVTCGHQISPLALIFIIISKVCLYMEHYLC